MKLSIKPAVVGFSALLLTTGTLLQAEEVTTMIGHDAAIIKDHEGNKMDDSSRHGLHELFMEKKLAKIHGELKLSPEQEIDWNQWTNQLKEIRSDRKKVHFDWENLKNLATPERLQKLIDANKLRQIMLEKVAAATTAFYSRLTLDQQKVFDDIMPFIGQGNHGKKGPKPEVN